MIFYFYIYCYLLFYYTKITFEERLLKNLTIYQGNSCVCDWFLSLKVYYFGVEMDVLKAVFHIKCYCKWKILIWKHLREQQQALKMCTQASGLYLHNPVTTNETTHMSDG